MSPEGLADMLQKTDRSALLARAVQAKKLEKTQATQMLVAACEELTQ